MWMSKLEPSTKYQSLKCTCLCSFLQSNVKKYEGKFGELAEAKGPIGKRRLGFHTG